MDKELDAVEEALSYFGRVMTHPKTWEALQHSSNVIIDRPSAQLLLTLAHSSRRTGCKLSELATKIGIEAPSVTRTVQKLEDRKLIRRAADPDDRRATYILPTDEGLAIVKSLRKAKRNNLRTLLSNWTSEDRQQLASLLHRLASAASAINDLHKQETN